MAESEVKGSVVYSTLLSTEQVFGADVARRLVEELPGVVGERLRVRSLVDSAWYPIEWLVQLDSSIERMVGKVDEPMRRIAAATVQRDLKGIYRFFVKILTPQMVISSAPRLFKQYYRGGEVVVRQSTPGFALLDYSHWGGFNRNLWSRALGGAEAALVACGASGISGRFTSGGQHEDAKLEMKWTASS